METMNPFDLLDGVDNEDTAALLAAAQLKIEKEKEKPKAAAAVPPPLNKLAKQKADMEKNQAAPSSSGSGKGKAVLGDSSAASQPVTSWASIVGVRDADLKFVEVPDSAIVDGVLSIPKHVLDKGIAKLRAALVAQFVGVCPPIRVISSMVNRLWGYEGEVVLSQLSEGFFLLEFPSIALCNWVLNRVWHIHHSPMVLRRWKPDIAPLDFEVKEVPTWLSLRHVPPQLITNDGIEWLVSRIGTPINKFIREGLTVKVCVLLDKSKVCPEILQINLNGRKVVIPVDLPQERVYDPKKMVQTQREWRPKAQPCIAVPVGDPVGDGVKPSLQGEAPPKVAGMAPAGGGVNIIVEVSPEAETHVVTRQDDVAQLSLEGEAVILSPDEQIASHIENLVTSVLQEDLEDVSEGTVEETVDEEIILEMPDGTKTGRTPGQATLLDYIGRGSVPLAKAKRSRRRGGKWK